MRFEDRKFARALEVLRVKAMYQINDNEYKHALDIVHWEWDQEVVDYYNQLAKLQFGKLKPDSVYLLTHPQSATYFIITREREGGFVG